MEAPRLTALRSFDRFGRPTVRLATPGSMFGNGAKLRGAKSAIAEAAVVSISSNGTVTEFKSARTTDDAAREAAKLRHPSSRRHADTTLVVPVVTVH